MFGMFMRKFRRCFQCSSQYVYLGTNTTTSSDILQHSDFKNRERLTTCVLSSVNFCEIGVRADFALCLGENGRTA